MDSRKSKIALYLFDGRLSIRLVKPNKSAAADSWWVSGLRVVVPLVKAPYKSRRRISLEEGETVSLDEETAVAADGELGLPAEEETVDVPVFIDLTKMVAAPVEPQKTPTLKSQRSAQSLAADAPPAGIGVHGFGVPGWRGKVHRAVRNYFRKYETWLAE